MSHAVIYLLIFFTQSNAREERPKQDWDDEKRR